jgi:hypothetical protein
MSHLGRPDGRKTKDTLRPVAEHLASLLPGVHVGFVDECVGPAVEATVKDMKVSSCFSLLVSSHQEDVRTALCCCWRIFVFTRKRKAQECARTEASSNRRTSRFLVLENDLVLVVKHLPAR